MTGLLQRFRSGDRQALARILSHIENQSALGRDALRSLSSESRDAHIIGLTGPPGAGKSTLANAVIKSVRQQDRSIAVLAIDPSSSRTGGATLGDRIRMLESQGEPDVYVRSMASRGQIGGLALAVFGSVIALDAFGFDVVLIETVGAGQDEVDIAGVADSVVVVQTPGMGDSIQAVKAGMLEIADIIVVNKADQPGADEVVRDLREQVRTGFTPGWRIPVLPVVARDSSGVEQLLVELARHRDAQRSGQSSEQKRSARLHQHARMIAIRDFADYLATVPNSEPEVDDPLQIAEAMTDAFITSRIHRVRS